MTVSETWLGDLSDVRSFVVDSYNLRRVAKKGKMGGVRVYIHKRFDQRVLKGFVEDIYEER